MSKSSEISKPSEMSKSSEMLMPQRSRRHLGVATHGDEYVGTSVPTPQALDLETASFGGNTLAAGIHNGSIRIQC